MKNWEGERPREPFARKTHVPIGCVGRRSYFGYTLQPATLVLILNKVFPAVT